MNKISLLVLCLFPLALMIQCTSGKSSSDQQKSTSESTVIDSVKNQLNRPIAPGSALITGIVTNFNNADATSCSINVLEVNEAGRGTPTLTSGETIAVDLNGVRQERKNRLAGLSTSDTVLVRIQSLSLKPMPMGGNSSSPTWRFIDFN